MQKQGPLCCDPCDVSCGRIGQVWAELSAAAPLESSVSLLGTLWGVGGMLMILHNPEILTRYLLPSQGW